MNSYDSVRLHPWMAGMSPIDGRVVGVLHIRDLPDDLHRAARLAALEADETLREFIIAAIEHELERRQREASRKRR